jgi:polysaccharide biosynthesis/export protein
MLKIRSFIVPLLVIIFACSCTPHRQLVYLQDKHQSGSAVEVPFREYIIKPNDILHVQVSSIDQESQAIFNTGDAARYQTAGGTGSNVNLYIYGYTVNETGQIFLPVIGQVDAAGNTLDKLRQEIQNKIDEYLVGATVSVKMANFSVTVLGEVRRPGNYYVYDNEFTILDALGLAGDLTDFGNRRVKVIRRTADQVTFNEIDITSRQAAASEYYFLQPGDLVYVEPHKVKRLGFAQFPFAVVFSAISTALLLINFLN